MPCSASFRRAGGYTGFPISSVLVAEEDISNLQPRFFHQVLHHKFRHGAAADIAVANEKYLYHLLNPLEITDFP